MKWKQIDGGWINMIKFATAEKNGGRKKYCMTLFPFLTKGKILLGYLLS